MQHSSLNTSRDGERSGFGLLSLCRMREVAAEGSGPCANGHYRIQFPTLEKGDENMMPTIHGSLCDLIQHMRSLIGLPYSHPPRHYEQLNFYYI